MTDREYFEWRAAQETALAGSAGDERAAAAHAAMAALYLDRLAAEAYSWHERARRLASG